MRKNALLYDVSYLYVFDLWDTTRNGVIYDVNPMKSDLREFYWICPVCKNSFKAKPSVIIEKYNKGTLWCINCIGRYKLVRDNESLFDKYPELCKYWDSKRNGYLTPKHIRPMSSNKVWWVCKDCGNSYLRRMNSQIELDGRWYCEECLKKHRKFKYGSLGGVHKDISLDWSDKNLKSPNEVSSVDSQSEYYWKCHICGEEWVSNVFQVVNGIKRCQVCAGRKYRKGYTDIKSKFPEIAEDWDYTKNVLRPEDIYYNDNKGSSFWFVCPKCGKSHYKSYYRARKTRGLCRTCSIQNGVLSSHGSLLDIRPDLASQLDELKSGVKASEVSPSSSFKLWWKCDKGHSFRRSSSERITLKGICPICNGKEVLKGFNDLESKYPEVTKYWCYELNSCLPSEVTGKSQKEVWWVCPECGNYYLLSVAGRTSYVGCPNCSNNGTSQKEKEVADEIESWGFEVERNIKLFEGSIRTLDIYIPSIKVGVEFNGLYWHREFKKNKTYHYDKHMLCKNEGIKLFYIWEDDYNENKELVFRYLKRELGVSKERVILGKNLSVGIIDYGKYKDFVSSIGVKSEKEGIYYLGIYLRKQLVGVALFDDFRDNGIDFILKEYCTSCILESGLINVVSFFREYTWCRSIVVLLENGSFGDNEYLNSGFKVVGELPCDYKYFKSPCKRISKELVENEDSCVGLEKIWDSGKTIYLRRWY